MREALYLLRHDSRITYSLVAIIIGTTAWGIVPSLGEHDVYPDYYASVLPSVFECEFTQNDRNVLSWYSKCASFEWFGSPTVIPILFNIAMMPLVYWLGSTITNDRLIGLISLVAFTYNPLYRDWVTSGTYDMMWAFFLILSVILIHKKGVVSPFFALVVAFFAKSMTLLYLPAWFYSVSRCEYRFWIFGITAAMLAFGAFLMYSLEIHPNQLVGNSIGFYPENWQDAVFRNISLLWQVIPALMLMGGVAAYLRPKIGIQGKKEVLVWMLWIIATTPIIHLFTEQLTFTYRFVVFGVFMSIFGAMTLVDAGNFIVEQKLKVKA